jgi:Lipase (class 3)
MMLCNMGRTSSAMTMSCAAVAHRRHSLGGALAQLAAYDIARTHDDLPASCYTFGGPRCGA